MPTTLRRKLRRNRHWMAHAVAVAGAVLVFVANGGLDGRGNAGLVTMSVLPGIVAALLAIAVGVLGEMFFSPSPTAGARIRIGIAAFAVALEAAVGLGSTLGCSLDGGSCGVTPGGGFGALLATEFALGCHWLASRSTRALVDRV